MNTNSMTKEKSSRLYLNRIGRVQWPISPIMPCLPMLYLENDDNDYGAMNATALYVPRSGLLCICHLRPIWRNACQLFWVGRPGRSYWHFQLLDILWWEHEVCTPDATAGRMIWQHGCLVAYLAPDSWGTGSYPDFWFAFAIVLLACTSVTAYSSLLTRHILYLLRRPPARLSNNTLLQTSKAAH